jgi:hypothetical protein
VFVGHYSASFAAKRIDSRIPLWLLFLAAQFLDVVWSPLVMLGVERMRIVPGITASNALDLYYMPYTHSLVGALFLSLLAGVTYILWRGRSASKAGVLVAAAVFSHWILDLIVHRPDLALYDNTMKMGFGLWNFPVAALVLEAALLILGMLVYLRGTVAVTPAGRWSVPVFCIVLLAIQFGNRVSPPPSSSSAFATTALACYILFAAVAGWLERKRQPAASTITASRS